MIKEIRDICNCVVRTDEQKLVDIEELLGIRVRYCDNCNDEFTMGEE